MHLLVIVIVSVLFNVSIHLIFSCILVAGYQKSMPWYKIIPNCIKLLEFGWIPRKSDNVGYIFIINSLVILRA